MDWFIQSFEEEDRKLDERLEQINADTLSACERILKNPELYSHRTVRIAEDVRKEFP